MIRALIAAAVLVLATPALAAAPTEAETTALDATVDALHDAAAKAEGDRYFALFTPDAQFIGTDVAERWDRPTFQKLYEPYFRSGKGWVYVPRARSWAITEDPCRCTAWFEEVLDSQSYGTTRGSGVLVLKDGRWLIAQYVLSFPIPNDIAKDITDQIKAFEDKARQRP